MVGDDHVLAAERSTSGGHFSHRVTAVAPGRVRVAVAADIAALDERGQCAGKCCLDLAGVLAYFGRRRLHPE